jgi:hypothetical protein
MIRFCVDSPTFQLLAGSDPIGIHREEALVIIELKRGSPGLISSASVDRLAL